VTGCLARLLVARAKWVEPEVWRNGETVELASLTEVSRMLTGDRTAELLRSLLIQLLRD